MTTGWCIRLTEPRSGNVGQRSVRMRAMRPTVSALRLQTHCRSQMREQSQTLVEIRPAFDEQPRTWHAPCDERLALQERLVHARPPHERCHAGKRGRPRAWMF
jgi:hypothetical protein